MPANIGLRVAGDILECIPLVHVLDFANAHIYSKDTPRLFFFLHAICDLTILWKNLLGQTNLNCISSLHVHVLNGHAFSDTVKPVCNDHLYDKIRYLWFIQ